MIQRVIKQIVYGFIVAFIAYTASQTLAYYPILYTQNFIDDSHFNRRFRVKGAFDHDASQVVILDIDDRSMKVLGDFNRFWSRRNLGEVIDNLKRDGAQIIFLDVIFRKGGSYIDNRFLVDSIRIAGNVFSGFFLNLDYRSTKIRPSDTVSNDRFPLGWYDYVPPDRLTFLTSKQIDFSFHELIMSSERIGFTNCMPDRDGVFRHIPLYMTYKQLLFPSVSLQMWLYTKGLHSSDAEISPRGIRFGETFIPADKYSFMRINYQYSGKRTFQYVSYVDVLNRNFTTGTFYNKIVMVGSSSERLNDIKKIPGNKFIPGVELHASALTTLLQEDFLRVMPGNVIFIITVVCGILSSLFFSFVRSIKKDFLFAVSVPLLFYVYAVYAFLYLSLLFNITTPSLVILIFYGIKTYPLIVSNVVNNRTE